MRSKWNTGVISAVTGFVVLLCGLFTLARPVQSQSAKDLKKSQPHFQTSDRCFACHNNLVSAAGEDVSIAPDWRASMMANSSRDPYWQAGVRRESFDHPESKAAIEDECSVCHMPMTRYEDKLAKMFQYPHRGASTGFVRHEPNHANHIHVRFKCPRGDSACR